MVAFFNPSKPRIGDLVYDQIDPRHVGRLVAIDSDLFGVVRWDNDQRSTLPLRHLRKFKEEGNAT